MIVNNLMISDDLYQKFGSAAALAKHIKDTSHIPLDGIHLSHEQVKKLQEAVGFFQTAEELVTKARRHNTIQVQDEKFVLDDPQALRLKSQAFFYAKKGEPRSEKDATPEQTVVIVNRYVGEQIRYYIGQMLDYV